MSACAGDDTEDGAPAATTDPPTTTSPEEADESPDEGEAAVGERSEQYSDDQWWLCRPDRDDDPCDVDLDSTDLTEDGLGAEVVRDPVDSGVDCFYVYPTVNLTGGGNADPLEDDTAERGVATAQASRYSDVCDVWAPLYRQLTLDAFGAENVAELREIAYEDVRTAFLHYLSERSADQPFLLVGHSQGTGMLVRLLQEEIEPDDELLDRMVSAHLIGGGVAVDEGSTSGGTFERLELCTSSDQVGCVVAFTTVGPDPDESTLARWGSAPDGEQRACVNPGAPGGGVGGADAIVAADLGAVAGFEAPTPWLSLGDLLVAECVRIGDASVLEVRPTDAATSAEVAEALLAMTTNVPDWGLHISEMSLLAGSLAAMAAAQVAAATD
ncbi:MAG: DUF3089 domain-containing protein [Acidimicrobiia bacterium]|nr:DUF3089 domain-containing protein [Acidimicrobiia bacterium]